MNDYLISIELNNSTLNYDILTLKKMLLFIYKKKKIVHCFGDEYENFIENISQKKMDKFCLYTSNKILCNDSEKVNKYFKNKDTAFLVYNQSMLDKIDNYFYSYFYNSKQKVE